MGYMSRKGRRPAENASKSSHSNVIKDVTVIEFLKKCELPKSAHEVEISSDLLVTLPTDLKNPIRYIVAVDGGYSEVAVKKEFPSSQICFFQFGALFFKLTDLEEISLKPFIDPEDIAKLKEIQRLEFVLPTKNIMLNGETSLIDSVRKAVFDFFLNNPSDDKLIDTLKWFVFEEYLSSSVNEYQLANCPICGKSEVVIKKQEIKGYVFSCNYCKGNIFLTDVFRLHEAVDNEIGAGGILGYLTNLFEQFLIIHLIRIILRVQPALLKEILFIKDGPLAFFGQTANMHRPMRKLITYLFSSQGIYLAGLEKSGAFVEHADEIAGKLKNGQVLMLSNDYIYKYVIPGKGDTSQPYARTSYYGAKLIFKSQDEKVYVVTLPSKDENIVLKPGKKDFLNMEVILCNLEKLKCDMYDSALIPIALANKLVSLANHPSSIILEKFAKRTMLKK